MRLVPQSHDRQSEFKPKLRQILTSDVSQLNILQLLPDSLCRIELRRIGRQPLSANMFRFAFSHKAPHLLTVNRRAVPDDHQLTFDLVAEMLQKSHTIGAI
jgi:hypothetical protein